MMMMMRTETYMLTTTNRLGAINLSRLSHIGCFMVSDSSFVIAPGLLPLRVTLPSRRIAWLNAVLAVGEDGGALAGSSAATECDSGGHRR